MILNATRITLKSAALVGVIYIFHRSIVAVLLQNYFWNSGNHYTNLQIPGLALDALGIVTDSIISTPLIPILFCLLAVGLFFASNIPSIKESRGVYLALMASFVSAILMIVVGLFYAYSSLGVTYFDFYTPDAWHNMILMIFSITAIATFVSFAWLSYMLAANKLVGKLTGILISIGILAFCIELFSINILSNNFYNISWSIVALIGICLPIGLWKLANSFD